MGQKNIERKINNNMKERTDVVYLVRYVSSKKF